MKISLLVPIIDPSIVNKFTDIPLWYICIFSLRLILDILDMRVVLTHLDFLVEMPGIIILMIIPTGSHSPSVHVINYASNISSDGVVGLDYNTIDSDSCGGGSLSGY